jgi:hypothetical protein
LFFTTHQSSHFEDSSIHIILRRIRCFIQEETAILLYFAYIQSRLMYMNAIWAAAPKYLVDSLEIIQRKALRVVFRKNWSCSRSELYSERILPVSTLCSMACSVLVFKIINGLVKNFVEFGFASETHDYPTRSRDLLMVKRCQSNLGCSNFYVRSFSEFNKLPANVRNQLSIGKFKTKLKDHLFTHCIE